MGLKKTVEWARNEWGIFRKGGEMGWGQRGRWLKQWVPFGTRTIGWGAVSITIGPLTRGAASTWAAKKWSQSSAKGLHIYIEATGGENVPEGGFVYASNHESLIDILVLGAALPGDFKWATKRSVMNIPFLGWHLRLAGHVPVDRNQGKSAAVAATEAFEGVLRDDKPLFTLMSRDEVDSGSGKSRQDRLVTVQIGRPLYPSTELDELEAVTDLRDRTRTAVIDMLAAASSPEAAAVSAQRV